MAQAMLLGLDPAAHESTLAMGSSEIAAQIAPCPALVSEAVDLFQRRPELALSRAPADRFAGAFLFPTYLEASYGHGVPGKLWTNLLAAGATRTVPGRYGWLAEPDVYDTLRRVFNGAGTSLDEALLGFAVARAFVGSRSDGAHLADVEQFGEFGRIRFDWALELASLPRRLALRPIEATGASYLWLDTAGASDNDRLTVVAECEVAQAMRFALVTVDARGQELGRHTAGRWGEATTQLTLEKLTGVAAVIVVAVAAGPDDRSHPFDPDDGPPSEVGCEVTFFRQ
jgi:hypothetical protein